MNNTELFKKIILKAEKNGYDFPVHEDWLKDFYVHNNLMGASYYGEGWEESINSIIFDLDFAKAYFGDEDICMKCGILEGYNVLCPKCTSMCLGEAWEYHIQQYAILNDEERLKYLEKFL